MPSGEGPALNVVNYTDDTPGRGDGSISQADVPSRMDFDDALARLERGNAILFRMDSPCLAQLAGRLSSADRRTVVLWGLECAGRVADRLRGMFPEDGRPAEAVRDSRNPVATLKRRMEARGMEKGHPDLDALIPGLDSAMRRSEGYLLSAEELVSRVGTRMPVLINALRDDEGQ